MKKNIYLVGGAVRDKLMDNIVSDKDYVAVGYNENDFSHLQKIGKDFPVFLDKNNNEIALARIERKTSFGYCGFETNIQNVSLEDDLKRRDLTINSIAFDEKTNQYIDPFNGQIDIQKKILRHTSEAFIEDPLRVLRLARFRAKFGYQWKIAPTTKVLVFKMKDELKTLQKDRVWKEVEKALILENTHIFFETLFELGVLEDIFPKIYELTKLKEGSIHHLEDSVFIHTMMVLKELKNESKLLKLSAIYHDIAKPYCYRKYGNGRGHDNINIFKNLIDIQIPTKIKKRMFFIIKNHLRIFMLNIMKAEKVALFFKEFKKDKQLLRELIILSNADSLGRICFDNNQKKSLNLEKMFKTFNSIVNYSPKEWIDSQQNKPTGEEIALHIHKKNIEFINELFYSNRFC